MQIASKLSILMLQLVLILVWLTLIPLPTAAWAADPQYRESDMEFVSRLAKRLDAAESSIVALEARLDESSPKQMRPNVHEAQLSAPEDKNTSSTAAATKPQNVDDAYNRVPERLRHKQRAVDTQPDDFGRIKVKFPWLRESIRKARKDLFSHELTHVAQSSREQYRHPELLKVERAVIQIEKDLTDLTTEVQDAEKAQTKKTISR